MQSLLPQEIAPIYGLIVGIALRYAVLCLPSQLR